MLPSNGLVNELGLTGMLGVRAIVFFGGRFYSPVYGHCEWTRGLQAASCAIGCASVPSDQHQGCGFHAHWAVEDSKRFVEQIRGTADCLVLVECFGRIAVHEKGFRAERARIVSVVDWDPRYAFFSYPIAATATQPSVPLTAAHYFDIPLVDDQTAEAMIRTQRERAVA